MLDQRRLATKENNDADPGLARLRSASLRQRQRRAPAQESELDQRVSDRRRRRAVARRLSCGSGGSGGCGGSGGVVFGPRRQWRVQRQWRVNIVGPGTVEWDAAGDAARDREGSVGDDSTVCDAAVMQSDDAQITSSTNPSKKLNLNIHKNWSSLISGGSTFSSYEASLESDLADTSKGVSIGVVRYLLRFSLIEANLGPNTKFVRTRLTKS
ncbi:hypothetical protein Scep_021987 [Stephania cephalantha]|uniref:Uncharacterized protein n=1 Tax=Stephania cephalantha TaxID=152367 RepID=A0AAP0FD42_9MAGN